MLMIGLIDGADIGKLHGGGNDALPRWAHLRKTLISNDGKNMGPPGHWTSRLGQCDLP